MVNIVILCCFTLIYIYSMEGKIMRLNVDIYYLQVVILPQFCMNIKQTMLVTVTSYLLL